MEFLQLSLLTTFSFAEYHWLTTFGSISRKRALGLNFWGKGSVLLPLATLTFLAASCAPQVAAETIAAIAQTESGRDPLAIHDNSTRESHHPAEKGEAAALARQLLRAGHSIDVGLMGINSDNWSWLGLSLEDAFEPCASIRAGAKVLTSLSVYNSGSPRAGIGYAVRVLAASMHMSEGGNDQPRNGAAPNPPAAPEVKPHEWDVFPDDAEEDQQETPATPAQQPTLDTGDPPQ